MNETDDLPASLDPIETPATNDNGVITSKCEPIKMEGWLLKTARWLEASLGNYGLIVIAASFCFAMLIFALWAKYDRFEVVEASVVALVGVVASVNFSLIGKRLARAKALTSFPTDGSCLFHNCFMLLNIISFGSALLLLTHKEKPYLCVLGIFFVFLSFVLGNIVQAAVLRKMLLSCSSQSGGQEQTGALLVETSGWLGSENGPSMVGYAIFMLIASIYELKHSSAAFAEISGGAATFHLTVSVFSFLVGLLSNPLKETVEHISWDKQTKTRKEQTQSVIVSVSEVVQKLVRIWRIVVASCLAVVIVSVFIANASSIWNMVLLSMHWIRGCIS